METSLTPEQIASYRKNGFVAHPNFLDAAEVAELKAAVLESVSELGSRKVAGSDLNWDDSGQYISKVFTQRMNLWRLNSTVKNYVMNPAVGRMICELEGMSGVRMWHDQALIKEPYGNPTGYHLDTPYWSFSSRQSLSIWIALEDATLGNGCMWFVPGSHHLARFDNAPIGSNMGDLFKLYPEMAQADPVAVPMKAGDCSFHNGLCAHGAGANMTRGRRIAMTCAYMPDGSTFNGQRSILPQNYFDSLQPGDPMCNDDWNPLIYGEA